MAAWVLIPALRSLFDDFNEVFPGRARASDGSVGDTAHAQTSSDHNPDETGNVPIRDADKVNEVHAIDVTADLREPGLSMEMVVQFLLARCRSGAEKRLRYIIYNKRIWSASWGWTQRTYGGASPHTGHAHFSASYESSLEANTASWYLEDLVEITDAQIDRIAAKAAEKVWAYRLDDPKVVDNPANPGADDLTAGVFQAWSPSYGRVDGVGAKVDALEAKVDRLIEMLRPPA